VDGHVALWIVVKLVVEGESVTRLVVTKEVVDGGPYLPDRFFKSHDHVKELERDGPIDPIQDGEVVTTPLRGRRGVGGAGVGALHMGGETIAT
jgi:hypothetical protein